MYKPGGFPLSIQSHFAYENLSKVISSLGRVLSLEIGGNQVNAMKALSLYNSFYSVSSFPNRHYGEHNFRRTDFILYVTLILTFPK